MPIDPEMLETRRVARLLAEQKYQNGAGCLGFIVFVAVAVAADWLTGDTWFACVLGVVIAVWAASALFRKAVRRELDRED